MEVGQELDALVAEKVMGWKSWHDLEWQDADGRFVASQVDYYAEDSAAIERARWSPSTDIVAAWQVVEEMCRNRLFSTRHRFIMALEEQAKTAEGTQANPLWWILSCANVPHAICLAALKAVGVETAI